MTKLTNAQIKTLCEQAGEGAAQRAANRGWDAIEQARCYNEAYQAEMAEHFDD